MGIYFTFNQRIAKLHLKRAHTKQETRDRHCHLLQYSDHIYYSILIMWNPFTNCGRT